MQDILIYIMYYLEPNKEYRYIEEDDMFVDLENGKKYTQDGFKNAVIFKVHDLVRIAKHLDRAAEAAQRLTNRRILD